MKILVQLYCTGLTVILLSGCIFQKPVQDNPYDPSCGGASIDSAQSCLKLEVMEVLAPALSFVATGNKSIDYYFKTTDNCFREKTGIPRSDAVQPDSSICSLTPHASKITVLQSVSVTFVPVNCPAQVTVDASGQVSVASGVTNGTCGIKMQVTGAGYKGTTPTAEAVVTVNIGVQQINGGNPTDVKVTSAGVCTFDIKDTYDNGTVIQYTDGSFTAMPATGTWSYSGGGGSVDSSGIFTPSGATGGFTGTITYTGVTTKNLNVTLTFPVTVADGVYVAPGGTGNGCLGTPAGSVSTAITFADSLTPKRTVYVAVGNYTANYQSSPITLVEGVSIRGGYNANYTGNPTPLAYQRSCNAATMSCLIDNTTAGNSRVITFGFGITTATVISGFFIAASSAQNLAGSTNNIAVYGTSSGTPTIQNNTIFGGAPIAATSSVTLAAIDAQSAVVIRNNFISGGVGPINAPGATVRGIYSVNRLNGVIANNIIEAGTNAGRTTTYALQLTNGCHPTMTNNTIINPWGSAIFMEDYFGSVNAFDGRITNNIIAWGGTGSSYALHETHTKGGPRSIENNAFLPLNSSATSMFNKASGSSTIANLELYAPTGGSDKTRGNILLPMTGKPFINFPKLNDRTTAAGSTTSLVVAGPANLYNDNDYVEVNGDNIPRQVTCGGTPCTLLTLTITSNTLASASVAGMEVRNWGTNNNASTTAYTVSYNLALNQAMSALTAQLFDNLRYGGKDTSGDVCGAPAGGPGTGPGGETCGQITTDFRTPTRTAINGNLADNTTNGAVPGGYSIGANERD